ncbi:TNNI1 protein, partial [Semnornis frantzii]|nr:TNNI1 protein [Semnornis frantzii]
SLMLAKAKEEWEQEIVDKQSEKERYLSERITPLRTSGLSLSQLQDLCRELHEKVEIVDEERYDIEAKCNHNTRELCTVRVLRHWHRLPREVFETHPWRHWRSDWMCLWATCCGWRCPCCLQGVGPWRALPACAAVGASWQERPVEVGDWRKNVEAMSGMEGRKKMFDAAKSPTGQ